MNEVTVYRDGDNAHWDDNPLDIVIETISVDSTSKLDFNLAEGGGLAISLLKK